MTTGMEEDMQRRIAEASALSTHLEEREQDTSPALETWLASHPLNRRIWAQRQQTWNLLESQKHSPELLALRQRALGEARRAGRSRWRPAHWRARAVAALVLTVTAISVFIGYDANPYTYRTGLGEFRVITLPDRSRVQLDASTELHVDYSKHARELTLIKGQARFDVTSDVARPFSVLAVDRRVVALGTSFNVDLLGKELRVTLIEGKVAVLGPPTMSHREHSAPEPIELASGQQLKVATTGEEEIVATNVQKALAWQSGKLVFDDEPLSQVVARISRYSEEHVSVADPTTGALRMSGVFRAGDVETFVATVEGYLNVTAERVDGGFSLRRSQ
jgi:transmembrane sensor